MSYEGIAARFCAQVRLHPTKAAVFDTEGSYTYQELYELSLAVKKELKSLVLPKGTAVGVLLPRVKEIAAAAFGCFFAETAYVPMDDTYPAERIKYMLSDAKAPVLLTFRKLYQAKKLQLSHTHVIFLDELALSAEPQTVVVPPADPMTRSVILYTSGTTGQPKGVVYLQAPILNNILCQTKKDNPISQESRVSQVAGFTFIASIPFLFAPLLVGGQMHIISTAMRTNLHDLYTYFIEHRITHTFLSSSLGIMMLEKYDLRGVNVMLAGEKTRKFHALYTSDVYNLYGTTEGSIIAYGKITGTEDEIPIGRPAENVTLYLADENGGPVKDGEVGEVVYHGDFMAQQYLNLPELTKEKWFIRNGLLFFKTGDRMNIGQDGLLYFVGRTDFMFKIHGFRVEAGEVEKQVLTDLAPAGVGEVVCVVKNFDGADHICIYYESEHEIDAASFTTTLPQRLAHYMIPDCYIHLEHLPRNANGKIVRTELPEPVNANEDFLYISSLDAIRIAGDVYEKHGVELDYTALLSIQSQEKLNQYIQSKITETSACCAVNAEPKKSRQIDEAPLTFSQTGVYVDCINNPDSIMYNLPMLISFTDTIDLAQLQKALTDIVKAHPSLHTTLVQGER